MPLECMCLRCRCERWTVAESMGMAVTPPVPTYQDIMLLRCVRDSPQPASVPLCECYGCRRRRWHSAARRAKEHGKPIPPRPEKRLSDAKGCTCDSCVKKRENCRSHRRREPDDLDKKALAMLKKEGWR
jgi:hypothetical protein